MLCLYVNIKKLNCFTISYINVKVFEFMNKGGIHLLDWKEYRSNTNKTAVQ